MPSFRFSLLTLFGVTAYVAVGAAALIHPSEFWTSLTMTAVYICLLMASLRAIYANNSERPFWIGFLVFGWGYSVLCQVGYQLITDYLLQRISKGMDFLITGNGLITLPFALLGGIIARVMYARSLRDGEDGGPHRPA